MSDSESSFFTGESTIAPQLDQLINGEASDENIENETKNASSENESINKENAVKKAAEENKEEDADKKVEEQDPLSKKFAALSRREKSIREREKALEQRMNELEQRLKSQSEPTQSKQAEEQEEPLDSLIRKNPMKALEKYGWDLNKLAESVLSDGKLPMDMQLQLMREELKKEMMSETESLAEKYEFIIATDNQEMVYDTINEYHATHGEILPIEEAAELVEAYLEEQARGVFEKTKKAKSYLQPAAQATKPNTQTSKANSPTLTNEAAGTVPSSEKPYLSDEESLREAAKLIRWSE
jgi:DNA repair exonuclease SbcCD ATPase subunit